MTKCPRCITGRLNQSGCHLYCDKCTHAQFVVTQEYIDSCIVVLSELVSNTKFNNRNDLGHTILSHIDMHLPRLGEYFISVTSGQAELMAMIMESIEDQAINLQIDQVVLNEEVAAKSLRCNCGREDFKFVKIGELECECSARYIYEEEEGIYQPYFLCECGSVTYIAIDTLLAECTDCGSAYTHDAKNDLFRRL